MLKPTLKKIENIPVAVRGESVEQGVTQRAWVPLKGSILFSEVKNKYHGDTDDRFIGVYIARHGMVFRVTGEKCAMLDGAATTRLRYEADGIVDELEPWTRV